MKKHMFSQVKKVKVHEGESPRRQSYVHAMVTCMVNNMRMFIAHFSWSGNEASEEMVYLSRKIK